MQKAIATVVLAATVLYVVLVRLAVMISAVFVIIWFAGGIADMWKERRKPRRQNVQAI